MPILAATVISRASLPNILERTASTRPLRCMMFLNCEWPAIAHSLRRRRPPGLDARVRSRDLRERHGFVILGASAHEDVAECPGLARFNVLREQAGPASQRRPI